MCASRIERHHDFGVGIAGIDLGEIFCNGCGGLVIRERFFAYANALVHPGLVRWKRLFRTF